MVNQYKKQVKRDYVWVGDDKIVSGKAAGRVANVVEIAEQRAPGM